MYTELNSIHATNSASLSATADQVLEFLPHAVVVIDRYGVVSWFNHAMQQLLPDLVLGDAWADILDSIDAEFSQGHRYLIETTPMSEGMGQLITLTDTTARAKMQQEALAVQAQRARAAMAHQLRTPLAAAMTNLSCLVPTDNQRSAVDRLKKNLTSLNHEISNMMLFLDGKLAHQSLVSVKQFVSDVQLHFDDLFDNLTWQIDVQNQRCCVSREHFIGALHNLIHNAVQSAECAKIRIFTQSDHLIISIENTVEYLAPKLIESLLRPFETSKSGGSGIGVNIAKRVIEAHSATLSYSTLGPEGGSGWLRAKICVPLIDKELT